MKEKILIFVPASTARGGITNYYEALKTEFPQNVEYFIRGARTWPVRKGYLSELVRAINDYKLFRKRIKLNDIKLVQTTTSLSLTTTLRDGLFIRYASKRGLKTITFFRGWDENAYEKIKRYQKVFSYFIFKSNRIITLSVRAKTQLRELGCQCEIEVESTTFDKHLTEHISESFILNKFQAVEQFKLLNILFLSRIERKKGIYDLLNAFEILHRESLPINISLTICGDGFELDKVKIEIKEKDLKNVVVKGFVHGDVKRQILEGAHLFVLPSYSEGMPNSVLEAMGSGIPVITTPVGGVVDFFKPGINGYYSKVNDSQDLSAKILSLVLDNQKLTNMALNNYKEANEKFRSDKVAGRMMNIFSDTINQ